MWEGLYNPFNVSKLSKNLNLTVYQVWLSISKNYIHKDNHVSFGRDPSCGVLS